jgi:hypothetical protein
MFVFSAIRTFSRKRVRDADAVKAREQQLLAMGAAAKTDLERQKQRTITNSSNSAMSRFNAAIDVDVDFDIDDDDGDVVPGRPSIGVRERIVLHSSAPTAADAAPPSSTVDEVDDVVLRVPTQVVSQPSTVIVAASDSVGDGVSADSCDIHVGLLVAAPVSPSDSTAVSIAPGRAMSSDLDDVLAEFESLPTRKSLMYSSSDNAGDRAEDDNERAGDLAFGFDSPVKGKRKGGARSRLRFKFPLDLRGALSSTRAVTNEAAKKRLMHRYRALEPDWWFALHNGHNILIDGVGANEQFVNDLVSRRVPRGAVMTVVSCDHPNSNIKQLLMALAHVTVRGVSVFRGAQGIVQQSRRLTQYLDTLASLVDGVVPQYLVMHNIDAPALNQLPDAQETLAILCSCRLMRVVATARNPRVALLWSHTVWRRMRWYNVHVSTMAPILSELVRVGRNRSKQHASTRRSALLVLSSVSSKARVIFAAFLRTLLRHPDEGGVKMSALYDVCHAQFLVSSVLELRQQLVEFRTHSLIVVTGSGFAEKMSCSLAAGEVQLLLHDIEELEQKGVEALDDDDK